MKPHHLLYAFLIFAPAIGLASDNYLVGIPGLTGGDSDFNTYFNALYALFVGIAALLAVVKIVIAGLKYMFTDIVPQKSQAKNDIRGALVGLVIVLSAVLILEVINPTLTKFTLEVELLPDTSGPGGGGLTPSSPVDVGGKRIPINVTGLSDDEKLSMCENIDQDICASSGAFPGDNPYCYRGTYNTTGSGGGECLISAANNVREGEKLRCATNNNTGSASGESCRDTGICSGTGTVVVDCSGVIDRCVAAGYKYKRTTSLWGTQHIECTNNLPNTYDCLSQGRGSFDCSIAENECRATDRTPTSMSGQPDKIACS